MSLYLRLRAESSESQPLEKIGATRRDRTCDLLITNHQPKKNE
jgi:hypothetical protein